MYPVKDQEENQGDQQTQGKFDVEPADGFAGKNEDEEDGCEVKNAGQINISRLQESFPVGDDGKNRFSLPVFYIIAFRSSRLYHSELIGQAKSFKIAVCKVLVFVRIIVADLDKSENGEAVFFNPLNQVITIGKTYHGCTRFNRKRELIAESNGSV